MRILIGILFTGLVIATPASACDLKNISFGDNIDRTVSKYKLEVMQVVESNKEGEFILSEMGKVVCDDLPEQSLMEFIFIDDVLVKISINNPNTSEELLKYAKEAFGENDDIDRKKASNGKTSIALWNKESRQSAIYSTHIQEKQGAIENLSISSKMHGALFEKNSKAQGKIIDADLKAKGLGKYSSGYIAGYGKNSSSGSKTEEYDPNALQRMKDRYDNSDKEYKERNKNKPREGRY